MINFNQFTDGDGYDYLLVVFGEYLGNEYCVIDAFNLHDGTRFVYVNGELDYTDHFEQVSELCCAHEDGMTRCCPF